MEDWKLQITKESVRVRILWRHSGVAVAGFGSACGARLLALGNLLWCSAACAGQSACGARLLALGDLWQPTAKSSRGAWRLSDVALCVAYSHVCLTVLLWLSCWALMLSESLGVENLKLKLLSVDVEWKWKSWVEGLGEAAAAVCIGVIVCMLGRAKLFSFYIF